MQTVRKIDGFGTRKDGSGGEVVNLNEDSRFIELYAQESIAKGDIVSFSYAAAIDGTDATDYGYGNIVVKANNAAFTTQNVIGVAAEAVTLSADDVTNAAWKKIRIQVSGRCEFVNVKGVASVSPGQLIAASNTDGQATAFGGGDAYIPFGVHLEDGTDATADSVAYLINPFNL